ncbi:MAG TPA: hypothetical protein VFL94_01640 [Actinomycetales bacterium]|nr:hypothetical protein [Actinomycetales bacterium]
MTSPRRQSPRLHLIRERLSQGGFARAVAVALLALSTVVAGATTASADPSLPVTGISVDQGDGTVRQAVHISRLYPGSQQQVVFLLDGDHPQLARRMELGVTGLADFENECIHPESGAGDTSCGDGPDQGELSRFLDVTLQAGTEGSADGHRTCAPEGEATTATLKQLVGQPTVVGLPSDDGTLCVIATFGHRDTPGDNVTQTDEVRFDLRLRFDTVLVGSSASSDGSAAGADQAEPQSDPPSVGGAADADGTTGSHDGTEVRGVKYERPVTVSRVQRGRLDLGALPRTGLSVGTVMIASSVLLGAGTVMVAVVHGRRRRAEEVA